MKIKRNLGQTESVNSLFNSFSYDRILDTEASRIKGGDPGQTDIDALIKALGNIFVRTSNCTDPLWNEFNKDVSLLAGTNVGYDMLKQIVDNANGKHISITGINPNTGANGAQYHDNTGSGGSIDLGALIDPATISDPYRYKRQLAIFFGSVAHELFHAQSFIVNNPKIDYKSYSHDARFELDAYLFEALADTEIDEKSNTKDINSSYLYLDNILYNTATPPDGTNVNSIYAFQKAYYDIFINKNFTLDNYNVLASQLFTSSEHGVEILDGYKKITTLTEDQFENSALYKFYNSDFSKSSYFNDHTPLFPFSAPVAPVKTNQNGTASTNPVNDDTGHQTVHYNADGTVDNGSSGTGTGIGGGSGASSGGPSTGSNSLGGAGLGYGIGVTVSSDSGGSSGSGSGGSNTSSSNGTGADTTPAVPNVIPPTPTKPPLRGFK